MQPWQRQTILERIQNIYDTVKESVPDLDTSYKTIIVNTILNNNININEQCRDTGDTALMMALKRDRSSLAKILLDIGTDINVKNRFGELAYNIACKKTNSYNEIANLIRAKMEKQQRNEDSTTLSQSICKNAKEEKSKYSQGEFTSKTRGSDEFSPANIGKVQSFLDRHCWRQHFLEPEDTVRFRV